ncbi:bacteriocin ABC transporter [Spiroplasma alleghenense]|uniref:Bacteriocin ABC transporter n=2 Tax=Spiroplasma alleghenense TaxID=216931 RepID=A0A345Z3B8_9MOLU|nr:bacteriocin ABC transporter [Spiroplasma alleghenense]
MVIEYYQNKKISLDFLKFKFNLDENPKNLNEVSSLLGNYGIEIKTFQAEISDLLNSLKMGPLIALIKNKNRENHLVLIYKVSKDRLLIADPNNEAVEWMSISQFSKIYQGIFSIAKKVAHLKKTNISFFNNFKIIRENVFFILFITFFSLACDLMIILSNSFIKDFLVLVETNFKNEIMGFFFGFAIIFMTFLAISYFQTILIREVYKAICQKQKLKITKQFLNINYEKFKNVGEMRWYQMFADLHSKNEIIVIKFFKYLNSFIIAMICLFLLIKINIYFFSFVIIENFIILLISRIFYTSKKELSYKIKNSENIYQKNLKDLVDGFLTTKTRFSQKNSLNKIMKSYNENLENNKKMGGLSTNIDALEYVINKFFYLLVFYFATFLITKKELHSNDLIYFSILTLQIKKFFSSINFFLDDVLKLKIINENLSFLNLVESKGCSNRNIKEKIVSINIKDFSKYSNNKLILNDFNCYFTNHNFLKGKNGSGKTTLMLSIAGIINNFSGEIFYNKITSKSIENYNRIMYLSSNDFVSDSTVANYIKNNWEIEPRFASAYDSVFKILIESGIDFNKKMNSNASNFSVGQKQIINFASIIFTNYDVYLIDESLSNVEFEIKNSLIEIFLKIHFDKLVIFCDHDIKSEKYFSKVVEVK